MSEENQIKKRKVVMNVMSPKLSKQWIDWIGTCFSHNRVWAFIFKDILPEYKNTEVDVIERMIANNEIKQNVSLHIVQSDGYPGVDDFDVVCDLSFWSPDPDSNKKYIFFYDIGDNRLL